MGSHHSSSQTSTQTTEQNATEIELFCQTFHQTSYKWQTQQRLCSTFRRESVVFQESPEIIQAVHVQDWWLAGVDREVDSTLDLQGNSSSRSLSVGQGQD